MKTIEQQVAVLKKHFPKVDYKSLQGEGYVVLKWQSIALTYSDALERVFGAIESTRKFYNYRRGEMGSNQLLETERKAKAMSFFTGDAVVLDAQLGQKFKGKSVNQARSVFEEKEFGLGAFEVACILLTHPDTLMSLNDLWVDCPGDEYRFDDERGFSCAPLFDFYGGKLGFFAGRLDIARDVYGSASASLPQSLGNRNLESLSLEARVKSLEAFEKRVRKFLVLE